MWELADRAAGSRAGWCFIFLDGNVKIAQREKEEGKRKGGDRKRKEKRNESKIVNYTEEKICYIPDDHTCASLLKSKPWVFL